MKAKLTFKLPEETEEFKTASNATRYKLLLWDLDQWLRGMIKHGINKEHFYESEFIKFEDLDNEDKTSGAHIMAERIREEINIRVREENLDLY
jgi:hypothetical protein